MKRLQHLIAIATVGVLLSAPADAARPSCAGGVFVSHAPATSPVPPLLVLGEGGRVAAIGSCTIKVQKGSRKWPVRAKLVGCDGAPRKVTLRGRWTAGCDGLTIALRGKRFRHDLAATRSACGDGFVDVAGGETCESASDCGLAQQCTACGCEDTDCIPGALEAALGLDPGTADSDHDGFDDGQEDSDGDGVANCDELAHGTALNDTDSDDDGSTDGEEAANRTDPLDPLSKVLAPGDVVTAAIGQAGEADGYAFRIDVPSRHVLLRAVDLDGSEPFRICVNTYDADGDLYGAQRCGDSVARVVRNFGPGTYTIVVTDSDGADPGAYRLQYLPIEPAAATTLPVGPEAFVDGDLPRGLLHLYRFTLAATRRVAVRAGERGPVAPSVRAFEPCFAVLTEAGDPLPDAQDCNGTNAARDVAIAPGTYYVLVSDEIDDADGPYRLRMLPLQPDFAHDLAAGPQCRTLDGWGEDVDVHRITLETPSTVGIVLSQQSNEPGFQPCLRLWSETTLNAFYGTAECSGPVALSLPLAAGTYYATVHDDFRTSPGSYCLAWQ
jgi:hypothetical protein